MKINVTVIDINDRRPLRPKGTAMSTTTPASAPPRAPATRGKRLALALAVLVSAVLAATGISVWHTQKAEAFEVGTWYNLQSRHSGLVLGIRAASLDNGAEAVQWASNGSYDQQFRFVDAGSPEKQPGGEYALKYTVGGKPVGATIKASGGDLFNKNMFRQVRAPQNFLK